VLDAFARHYTSLGVGQHGARVDESFLPERDVLERIEGLEQDIDALQQICDERMAVIDGLAKAAEERLALANTLQEQVQALESRAARLQRDCDESLRTIEGLDLAARERQRIIDTLQASASIGSR
jgi:hypothetical protein